MKKGAKKAVAIVSGGIDSSTLLYKLIRDVYDANALTFIYGQKHAREIDAAKDIARRLKIPHKVVDVSALQEILTASALTNGDIAIPEVPETKEHYDTLKITIVPNRNSILLSMAIGYAISIGANHVFYGAHHSDRGVYPDCRQEFVKSFEASQRLANDNQDLHIEAPFVNITKADIIKLGSTLGVPFELTWSCYKGGKKHCGVCSSCQERKRAFNEAGMKDPTVYER